MPKKSRSKPLEDIVYYVEAVYERGPKPKFTKSPDFATKEDGGHFVYLEGPVIEEEELDDLPVYIVTATITTDNIRNIEQVFYESGDVADITDYNGGDWLEIEMGTIKLDTL